MIRRATDTSGGLGVHEIPNTGQVAPLRRLIISVNFIVTRIQHSSEKVESGLRLPTAKGPGCRQDAPQSPRAGAGRCRKAGVTNWGTLQNGGGVQPAPMPIAIIFCAETSFRPVSFASASPNRTGASPTAVPANPSVHTGAPGRQTPSRPQASCQRRRTHARSRGARSPIPPSTGSRPCRCCA